MHTGRPKRLPTFDYRGLHRYFLTFCTFERRRLFASEAAVQLVLAQIMRAANGESFAVSAYCFMPDHLHLLVEGESLDSDGQRLIAVAKQLSGFHYRKAFGQPLWQRYGFEHVLRNDAATMSAARYIVENPVRAGLVRAAEDYRFSGSMRYSIEQMLETAAYDPRSR